MNPLTIHCECGVYYHIPVSNNKKIREQYIKYARCPICKRSRDPDLKIPAGEKTCLICNMPSKRLKKDLCPRHYLFEYRKNLKKVSMERGNAIIPDIVNLSYGIYYKRNWHGSGDAESRK